MKANPLAILVLGLLALASCSNQGSNSSLASQCSQACQKETACGANLSWICNSTACVKTFTDVLRPEMVAPYFACYLDGKTQGCHKDDENCLTTAASSLPARAADSEYSSACQAR